ncbi:hypothetical protein EVAR_51995_1 [Eumeta japonica]|uniref:Uncharacterized protein n=1 Tax=Eumeta variegata TaxID=151549 RepID=A0A4C1Y2N2_EUMVA|nr:hypothetical protein EVAR_51995_1 [Eumeta japonica]
MVGSGRCHGDDGRVLRHLSPIFLDFLFFSIWHTLDSLNTTVNPFAVMLVKIPYMVKKRHTTDNHLDEYRGRLERRGSISPEVSARRHATSSASGHFIVMMTKSDWV